MSYNNPTIDASVIVCTYNRAESLKQTITALVNQDAPSLNWELIIVDNNSTDHTKEIVNSFPEKQIKYTFEARQGLSHARNHGISSSRGGFILFTDDDVCPEQDWLSNTVRNMLDYKCAACGGYIAPIWEIKPPPWLNNKFHGYLAIKLDTDGPKILSNENELPFGANMAFTSDVFKRYGLFDTDRGRKGAALASGEDGEFFNRLVEANEKIMHFPNAKVHHKVEAFRLKKSYFRKWRYQTSKNLALTLNVPGTSRIFGVPPYILLQLCRSIKRAISAKLLLPDDEAFLKEIIIWHFLGLISGLYSRGHN